MKRVNRYKPQPVGKAFQRLARRTFVALALFATILFAILSRPLLHRQMQGLLEEQARICAAALIPGRNGDLSDTVAALQARNERVIAIAALDAFGQLESVYPDRPAHHQAVYAVQLNPARPTQTISPQTGEAISVIGVPVALEQGPDTSGSPAVTHVLVLLQTDLHAGGWAEWVLVFGLLCTASALGGVRNLTRWFERQVARPLRSISDYAPDGAADSAQVPVFYAGSLHETGLIAGRFQELLQSVAESDARTRRLEREAHRQILSRELGFDRELRRERDKAWTDRITGLRNRTFLEEQLEPLIDLHRDKNAEFSAVMIDLDNFKVYNDSHGHQVGDALLRFAGALIRGSLRPADHAVRYGGDEFLLLLPETAPTEAAVVADRIIKLFAQYSARLGREDAVTMSAGVAALRENACTDGHELIAKADAALYAVKRTGKNAVSLSSTPPRLEPAPA